MSASSHSAAPYYFVPQPSRWPIYGSVSLLTFGLSMAALVNGQGWARYTLALFAVMFAFTLVGWFGDAARESERGLYNQRVDVSYRWSMGWFIFSEVMFFAAFFGALYYARTISTPWLSELESQQFLWPDFSGTWPNLGPAGTVEPFRTIGPWPIPTINTALLLSSGVTLTIAHHALKDDNRRKTMLWLAATVALGIVFLVLQVQEYTHAYHELNLTLKSGIFGSTFFMLTGFHGFHVTVGALMLAVVLYRMMKGHLSAEHHFAFEGAAWYWHFVDVVWLLLYVVVYWL